MKRDGVFSPFANSCYVNVPFCPLLQALWVFFSNFGVFFQSLKQCFLANTLEAWLCVQRLCESLYCIPSNTLSYYFVRLAWQ